MLKINYLKLTHFVYIMGRGKGKNNLSDGERRERKNEYNRERYFQNSSVINDKWNQKYKDAERVFCECGGFYKNIPANKCNHLASNLHNLYEIKQTYVGDIVDKHKMSSEEANKLIDDLCFDNFKYTTSDKLYWLDPDGEGKKFKKKLNIKLYKLLNT